MTITGTLLNLAMRGRQWCRDEIDKVFRQSIFFRTVRQSQQRTDFKDRFFACDPREGWEGEPIFMQGRHLTPTDKVLRGQNTAGGPAWLKFSEMTLRWPEGEV